MCPHGSRSGCAAFHSHRLPQLKLECGLLHSVKQCTLHWCTGLCSLQLHRPQLIRGSHGGRVAGNNSRSVRKGQTSGIELFLIRLQYTYPAHCAIVHLSVVYSAAAQRQYSKGQNCVFGSCLKHGHYHCYESRYGKLVLMLARERLSQKPKDV